MFGFFSWVFLFHFIRLDGGMTKRGTLKLSDQGHTSTKPTALEGTWSGIDELSNTTITTATMRGKPGQPKKILRRKVKNDKLKVKSGKKLQPLAVKMGKWTCGVVGRLCQSQAYPKEFCQNAARAMRRDFEAQGETFESLKADLQTCKPPAPRASDLTNRK